MKGHGESRRNNYMSNFYLTIEKPSFAEYKDRGSRFLAYAYPLPGIDAFKKNLKSLKDEHSKAAHHCFAYRLGTDGNRFRAGDDGEPAGTAGKPILGQLDSKGLTDTLVVVVRYFGGTLLGVPGLIQAYRTAASLALQLTPIVRRPVLVSYELQFDYTLMNEIMMLLKRSGSAVQQQDLQLFCRMEVAIPKAEEESIVQKLQEMPAVSVKKSGGS